MLALYEQPSLGVEAFLFRSYIGHLRQLSNLHHVRIDAHLIELPLPSQVSAHPDWCLSTVTELDILGVTHPDPGLIDRIPTVFPSLHCLSLMLRRTWCSLCNLSIALRLHEPEDAYITYTEGAGLPVRQSTVHVVNYRGKLSFVEYSCTSECTFPPWSYFIR
jgi:hypothetical protein